MKAIINAVGPMYRGGPLPEQLLRDAVRSALLAAAQHKIDSVALPTISTGAYHYPEDAGIEVLVSEVRKFCDEAQYEFPRHIHIIDIVDSKIQMILNHFNAYFEIDLDANKEL